MVWLTLIPVLIEYVYVLYADVILLIAPSVKNAGNFIKCETELN